MGFNFGDVVASARGPVYPITNSLRFDTTIANYLTRTPSVAGNRQKWTYSCWIKRGGNNTGTIKAMFSAGTNVYPNDAFLSGFGAGNRWFSSQFYAGVEYRYRFPTWWYQDYSAWYHYVFVWDTTQANADDRVSEYINGIKVTSFSSFLNPALNENGVVNTTVPHRIGDGLGYSVAGYMDGYMTEINFLDGYSPTTTTRTVNGVAQTVLTQLGAFSPMTGSWEARKWTGSYGTNGFYLNFSNGTSTTTLGYDYSGNNNHFTLVNFTRATGVTDCWCIDVPTGSAAPGPAARPSSNYCQLNQIDIPNASVYAGGVKTGSVASHIGFRGTMAYPTVGKYYFEVAVSTTTSSSVAASVGICTKDASLTVPSTGTSGTYAVYIVDNTYAFANGSFVWSLAGVTAAANSVLQVAYDTVTGYLWIGKNNVWYNSIGGTTGNPSAGTNPTITLTPGAELFPYIECYANSLYANFGQYAFFYTPPTDYKTLCTSNLVQSTVLNGAKFMDVSVYTGNGSSQTIATQAALYPDLVWAKTRGTGDWHILTDSNTGVSKYWSTNSLNAQTTGATTFINAISSSGFTVGSAAAVNGSTYPLVAWQWQAGSGVTSANTVGQCASTVSVNQAAGFSIVKYTGTGTTYGTSPTYNTSVGHGLNSAPKFWTVKRLDATAAAFNLVYTTAIDGSVDVFQFQSTAAKADSGSALVSSSTVTMPFGNPDIGASGASYVMYCWAEVPGFSRMGSYLGANAANLFIYTGFRPKFIMIKCSSTTGDWVTYDTTRNPTNPDNTTVYELFPNLGAAETATNDIYSFSNGFRLITTNANINAAQTYLYMAFAENPLAQANAR